MDHRPHLEPVFTARPEWFNLSAARPVRVTSWVPGSGELRAIRPDSPEFPGWRYGDYVLTPEQQDQRPHDHQYYEINIVRRGVAVHRTDDYDGLISERSVVVMTPGSVHSIYGVSDLEQTNVYYLPEWLCDDLTAFWGQEGLVPLFLAAPLFNAPIVLTAVQFEVTEEELASVDQELADIGRECYRPEPSLTFLNAALLKMLMKLSRAYVRQCPNNALLRFRPEVRRALEHIEQCILQCEPLSIRNLAGQVGLSPHHFTAVFKEATGWSPMEYYQRRRVQHVCRLLLDPERTITDIALELGYSDSAHLCHFFKRHQGLSPRQYRAPLLHGAQPTNPRR